MRMRIMLWAGNFAPQLVGVVQDYGMKNCACWMKSNYSSNLDFSAESRRLEHTWL